MKQAIHTKCENCGATIYVSQGGALCSQCGMAEIYTKAEQRTEHFKYQTNKMILIRALSIILVFIVGYTLMTVIDTTTGNWIIGLSIMCVVGAMMFSTERSVNKAMEKYDREQEEESDERI